VKPPVDKMMNMMPRASFSGPATETKAHIALLRAPMTFLERKRSYENFWQGSYSAYFTRGRASPPILQEYSASKLRIFLATLSDVRWQALLGASVCVACLSSALSTLLWLINSHSSYTRDHTKVGLILQMQTAMESLMDDFKFFPTFLLLGYMNYVVGRWQDFVTRGWQIQESILSLGMAIAAAMPECPDEKTRKLTYRIYRRLNAAHALHYRPTSSVHELAHLELDPGFVDRGLLTVAEARDLEPHLETGTAKFIVLTWIGRDLARSESQLQLEPPARANIKNALIPKIKDGMIDFDNTFVHLDPQQWSMLMTWLVNILVLCVIFGSPFRFFEIDSPVCFQVQTPVTVLVLALSFWAALAMCEELRNPFDEGMDSLNVDGMLSFTDAVLYSTMREALNLSTDDDPDEEGTGADPDGDHRSRVGP